MARASVAVLGLDALPYWVLPKLREEGLAPTITGGEARPLRAIPPITPASWPSILSGVNPGKHGLFSFFHYNRETHEQELVSAHILEHPRIHEMLSYEGIESFMLNPIPDYPLLPARRAKVLANLFFTPKPASHPRGLHEKYYIGLEWPPQRDPGYYEKYLEATLSLAEDLVREKPRLVWLTVNFPDAIYHKLPDTVNKPGKVSKLWRLADRIARVLKDNYDYTFVVSDHGFRIFKYRVNVNDILESHGYVVRSKEETEKVVEEELVKTKSSGTARINVPTWLYRLIGRLGLEPFARKVFYRMVRPMYMKITGKTLVVRSGWSIDYSSSKACMPYGGAYGVYLKPGVSREEVVSVLRKYKGLHVWLSEEIYSGPYMERGPDIVLVGDHENGYVLGPARIVGEPYTKTRYPGHDMWGVLAQIGGEQLRLPEGEVPNTLLTPLVQCLIGAPVSHMVDNKSLIEQICPGDVRYRNYLGKFLVSKRIALRTGTRQRR